MLQVAPAKQEDAKHTAAGVGNACVRCGADVQCTYTQTRYGPGNKWQAFGEPLAALPSVLGTLPCTEGRTRGVADHPRCTYVQNLRKSSDQCSSLIHTHRLPLCCKSGQGQSLPLVYVSIFPNVKYKL